MPARGRIVDAAVARQLIGLLSMLTAALSVTLAGHRAVPAEGAAHVPERQRQVDEGEHVVHTVRVLFGPASGEHHRRFGGAEHPRGVNQLVLRNAGDHLDALGPVRGAPLAHVLEPFGAIAMYPVSISLSRMRICSSPFASAASDPGRRRR